MRAVATADPFPSYTRLPTRLSTAAWRRLRAVVWVVAAAEIVVLFVARGLGLFLIWGLLVPALPLVWFTAPGIWRNLCPLATTNQIPRVFGFSRSLDPPRWLRDHGYLVGTALFFMLVPTRKVLLNDDGPALAVLLLVAFAAAFVGGVLVKGKGGWCSSVCPLLPVQRLYGQTPLVVSPNSHCEPCVGCAKNCFDFNPKAAYLADQYDDDDRRWSARRRLFAGAFPGMIVAFYTLPDPPDISIPTLYLGFGLFMAVGAGVFFALDAVLPTSPLVLTSVFGAVALNAYYGFTATAFFDGIGLGAFGLAAWVTRAVVFALSVVWVAQTLRREAVFRRAAVAPPPVRVAGAQALARHGANGRPEVTFAPAGANADDADRTVVVDDGISLLEVAERAALSIEAGCRMGVCGADPVAVLEGGDHLSACGADERSTLERLGYAANTRMACSARVRGSVRVSLAPERGDVAVRPRALTVDPSIRSVVVLGNGVAGVTTADHVRRNHPDCELHLVGRESHHLYNRMGIARLIYGRSAMSGLYLMPDSWYEDHAVTTWLNTHAKRVDVAARQIVLGTGETLGYDRLVLATGARSFVPTIEGLALPGSFVLREAADAIAIRAFAQQHDSATAAVAGGGLLGIEAAYALSKLGVRVRILERGEWLLRRQLDQRAATFLRGYLTGLGLDVELRASVAAVEGEGRVQQLELHDGRILPADLFLVCAGITPNTELASEAGLDVRRGVVVDDQMRTSDPSVFAVGDVAEHRGRVAGLWPPAVKQAEIAARNLVGDDVAYEPTPPSTQLKVVGVDLMSVGRIDPLDGEDVVLQEDATEHRYRKLVIADDGSLAGAILLGHPRDAPTVGAALEGGADLRPHVDRLRAGDWSALEPVAGPA